MYRNKMSPEARNAADRMNAITTSIAAIEQRLDVEDRLASDAERATLKELNREFGELKAWLAEPVDRKIALPDPQAPRSHFSGGTPVAAALPDHGFKHVGEYFNALYRARESGHTDQRLQAAATTYSQESVGGDGGFSVPPMWRREITEAVAGEGSLLALLDVIPADSNQVIVPVDETSFWSGQGVTVSKTAEAATITASKLAIKQRTVTLYKAAGLCPITDELATDSPAAAQYVMGALTRAIVGQINDWVLNGTGVGEPHGILKAPGLVSVAQEASGNGAGTLVPANAANMLSRIIPGALRRSFWVGHTTILPKVWTWSTGNNVIYAQDFKESPYGNLLGRPVALSEYAKEVGNAGDLTLVSPDGVIAAMRGAKADASIHFAFDQDLTTLRATMRYGQVAVLSAPLARKNGTSTLSHIVTTATRT